MSDPSGLRLIEVDFCPSGSRVTVEARPVSWEGPGYLQAAADKSRLGPALERAGHPETRLWGRSGGALGFFTGYPGVAWSGPVGRQRLAHHLLG